MRKGLELRHFMSDYGLLISDESPEHLASLIDLSIKDLGIDSESDLWVGVAEEALRSRYMHTFALK